MKRGKDALLLIKLAMLWRSCQFEPFQGFVVMSIVNFVHNPFVSIIRDVLEFLVVAPWHKHLDVCRASFSDSFSLSHTIIWCSAPVIPVCSRLTTVVSCMITLAIFLSYQIAAAVARESIATLE